MYRNIVKMVPVVALSDLLIGVVDQTAFSEMFSENAPFSWGDNNLTLISYDRFMSHIRGFADYADVQAIEVEYESECTPGTYIDLEA